MRILETDFVVIGSGLAGLATALWASPEGEVIVLAKDQLDRCNSTLAQGGIAAAVGQGDSPRFHAEDTLFAGAGMCEPQAVSLLTQEAPEIVEDLIALGTRFDLSPSGELDLTREGAHRLARVLHHGDSTGAEIWRALYHRVQLSEQVTMMPSYRAEELLVEDGRCCGVVARGTRGPIVIKARAVVLATGGFGQIFGRTTSSLFSTGDGLILAWRAGAVLTDLEFTQFHPTAFASGESPLFLISEAVRGEGAVLVTEDKQRFMQRYHPMAELAPRDIVSRAIAEEQEKEHQVFLDATPIGDNFTRRFPTIQAKLSEQGIDPLRDLIPVTPAAHFMMGGVKTDDCGRTNIEGLFACGEAASTGVHGANRLASNSLLETLVFGKRVAAAIRKTLRSPQVLAESDISQRVAAADNKFQRVVGASGMSQPSSLKVGVSPLEHDDLRFKQIQTLMWEHVGIVRCEHGLSYALRTLESMARDVQEHELELRDILELAKLMTKAALDRLESRGSHYRSDYPDSSPAWQKKHLSMGRYSA